MIGDYIFFLQQIIFFLFLKKGATAQYTIFLYTSNSYTYTQNTNIKDLKKRRKS